jgi:bifunctional ADP-heptose synthase (sugar kinase/adenylyltransferase)
LRTVENQGMAGNVYNNVLHKHFNADLATNSQHVPIVKTRYVEEKSNHLFLRIDSEDKVDHIEGMTLKNVKLQDYDCVVVSDYNKGYLNETDLTHIACNSKLSFLDTKKILGSWASYFTYIKINDLEYQKSKPFMRDDILSKTIITLGDRGCQLNGLNYPLENKVEALDVSGAGDTFLAALAVEFMCGRDITNAIFEANRSASRAVQKRGVVVA